VKTSPKLPTESNVEVLILSFAGPAAGFVFTIAINFHGFGAGLALIIGGLGWLEGFPTQLAEISVVAPCNA